VTAGQDFHLVSEPEFLDVEDAEAEHTLHIVETGGRGGLRGEDGRRLLESAVAQASATYGGQFLHTSIFQMAAAYAFHLAENQPFIDGNKRTALSCALLFLQLNGFTVSSAHNERMAEAMVDLGSRKASKEDLAMMFEEIAEKTETAR
jgi:death-on-curing protein